MIEEITLAMVEEALKGIADARELKRQDTCVTFQYKDKDGDNVTAVVTIEADERVTCMLPLAVPKEYFVTAMMCANVYNNQKEAHGTFAYATADKDDDHFIVIEAHLLSRGGISEQALKHFFRNFIVHVDSYEKTVIPAISELGPDSSFIKSGAWEAFWSAVGNVLVAASKS